MSGEFFFSRVKMAAAAAEEQAAEYHSKDFEWEDLRRRVEEDPSLLYHLSPSDPPPRPPPPPLPPSADADAWRSFHRRHADGKFFKERRYLLKEFPELVNCADNPKVLEIGCGNGSTVLPILRAKQGTVVYACDCSEEVLNKVKEIITAAGDNSYEHQFVTFSHDLTVESFPDWLFCSTCQITYSLKPECSPDYPKEENFRMLDGPSFLRQGQCCIGGVDFVTLVFTLSAIPYHKMSSAIKKCFSVLKPGCLLLFRDYGLYDMTMLRFLPEQRVGFREYMRSDGTFSYFFSLDVARDLFRGAGFTVLELEYCCVSLINRRNGKSMQRVWVHGKFQKPM